MAGVLRIQIQYSRVSKKSDVCLTSDWLEMTTDCLSELVRQGIPQNGYSRIFNIEVIFVPLEHADTQSMQEIEDLLEVVKCEPAVRFRLSSAEEYPEFRCCLNYLMKEWQTFHLDKLTGG